MKFLIMMILLLDVSAGIAQEWTDLPDQPEELGDVRWMRNYVEARAKALQDGKPIFILFQEVPGCSTCRNYGNDLLTHPHIVEAIETFFVPLAIYNNTGGEDAKVLKKFNEPAWNNPVARIISANTEQDIIPRLNGKYDISSLLDFLIKGMIESHLLVPQYLATLHSEYDTNDLRETHLSMYCFWTGEKALADMQGVIDTRAGYMNGTEVVKVKYDADQVSEEELIQYAKVQKCADALYSDDQREVAAAKKLNIPTKSKGIFRPDKQPKYYIYMSNLRSLPMTHLQALLVNRAFANNEDAERYLSPRQLTMMQMISGEKISKKDAIDEDFTAAWRRILVIM